MSAMASQIAGVSIGCSTVCSGADQRKHQSSASLAYVRGMHWWPVGSPHKGPVTRKICPSDDVIMMQNWGCQSSTQISCHQQRCSRQTVILKYIYENSHNYVHCSIWLRHDMETFSALLVLCEGWPVDSPHKGQWHGALPVLICDVIALILTSL